MATCWLVAQKSNRECPSQRWRCQCTIKDEELHIRGCTLIMQLLSSLGYRGVALSPVGKRVHPAWSQAEISAPLISSIVSLEPRRRLVAIGLACVGHSQAAFVRSATHDWLPPAQREVKPSLALLFLQPPFIGTVTFY